ncbi:MAG: hypothetical protein M1821_006498 [Bathelium mastoideum]|nr:MAG: hypothetical protein M1821_006498 [Bathelium mastoideum]
MAPTARKLGTKRKIICFSDFDGTIFMQDTGFVLFNQFGCGQTKAVALEHQIKTGERSFRDVSEEMWGSLNVTFDDGFEVMKTALEIDPAFREFHTFCQSNDIPFNVISAGLKPVLRGVLDHFIGQEASSNIKIIANDVQISKDGGAWKPVWLHDTPLGHDKARSITEARAQANDMFAVDGTVPLIVFIGDGVSDLPAAREADVLFARRGLRLEEYCIENRIPYIPFDTFADVQRELTKIARRDEEQTRGQGMPADFNPRANMWRRISSGNAIPLLKQRTPKVERVLAWPDALPRLGQESAPVAA